MKEGYDIKKLIAEVDEDLNQIWRSDTAESFLKWADKLLEDQKHNKIEGEN